MQLLLFRQGFNTQPPEGGWSRKKTNPPKLNLFQHTAARRRLENFFKQLAILNNVSTHSRPKAAGVVCKSSYAWRRVSTHSRPKAAGRGGCRPPSDVCVSTHSRPKAAGPQTMIFILKKQGFNTQPPEGGWA